MKTIYMEQTILLMSKIDNESTQRLVKSGQVKTIEGGINYLVISES